MRLFLFSFFVSFFLVYSPIIRGGELSTASLYEINDEHYLSLRQSCLLKYRENPSESELVTYKNAQEKLRSYVMEHHFHLEGPFKDIRNSLDLCYHGVYSLERQLLQEQAVFSYLKRFASFPSTPYVDVDCRGTLLHTKNAFFIAGPMGVGKGAVLKKLIKCGFFTLSRPSSYGVPVTIDFDALKELLPEFESSQGGFVHQESGYLGELVQEFLLKEESDFIIDGSLVNYEWNYQLMKRLSHLGYLITVVFVMANDETILQRALDRCHKGGRCIDPTLLKENIDRVKNAYYFLKRKSKEDDVITFFLEVDNEDNPHFINPPLFF